MNQPKVSVIIPVYNTEQYLRQCLDSVVNQTLRDMEIICVDDCSEDGSRAILEEYAARDSRIRPVYYDERRSASQARKDGVMMARGQYVMFLDSDDTLAPEACEELAAEMDERGVDMLQFGTFVDAEPHVAEYTVQFFIRFSAPYTGSLSGREVFDACFVDHKFSFNLWNKIYKAELCKKGFAEVADGFFPKAEDMYAFSFLAWYAESFTGIEKQYYHYKYGRGITGGGRSIGLDTLRLHCAQFDVAEKCREFLTRQNAWENYADAWETMNRDLAIECVRVWFLQLSAEDGPAGFDELAAKWGCDYILPIIQKALGKNAAEASLKMAGAKALIRAGICADPADAIAPEGFDSVVPVVFATNEKYAPYLGVTLQSILDHAAPGRFYRAYVLYSALTDNTIRQLEAQSGGQLSVRCLNVDALVAFKETELYINGHLAREAYYRLVIPEILGFYPHVIYLDCDVVVLRDIADIVPDDMGDCLLAAVRDTCSEWQANRLRDSFGLDPARYFNSGVFVMNLTRWKAEHVEEKCFAFIRETPPHELALHDQDVLNVVCRDRVRHLDAAWNFCWHMVYGEANYVAMCKPIADRIGEDFYILHFASYKKPWELPELPLSRYFWRYARRSDFYEIILKRMVAGAFPAPSSAEREDELSRTKRELACVHGSVSYRLGRAVTWLPRKIRGGVRCLRDHGPGYTFRRCLYHLGLRGDKK